MVLCSTRWFVHPSCRNRPKPDGRGGGDGAAQRRVVVGCSTVQTVDPCFGGVRLSLAVQNTATLLRKHRSALSSATTGPRYKA